MLIENPDLLRNWLTTSLTSLCDADPAALGKYVLALLKKDKPDDELKQGLLEQLDVFLQQETVPFVEKLMDVLQSKEYLTEVKPEPKPGSAVGDKGASSSYEELPYDSSTTMDITTSTDSSFLDPLNTSSGSNRSDEVAVGGEKSTGKFTRSMSKTSGPGGSSLPKDRLDKERNVRRKSRSPRRNRSRERGGPRAWSPRGGGGGGGGGRYNRGIDKRSPPPNRRLERDVYDRRRSPRNRSSSPPHGRVRSPHRYGGRRAYDPSFPRRPRSRSPMKRDRSRSRSPVSRSCRLVEIAKGSSVTAPTSPSDQRIEITTTKNDEEYSSKKGNRCKDYDERGLCMRGEMCPFDHGTNPVVLQDVAGIKRPSLDSEPVGLPYPDVDNPAYRLIRPHRPMLPIDPMHDPAMLGWPPMLPFHHGMGPRMRDGMMLRPPIYPMPTRELINVPVIGESGNEMMDESYNYQPMHHMGLMYPPMRGGHGMRGRGRGRGGFDHSRLGIKPRAFHPNCSLKVKKIPNAQNTISDLNSHFVQFGKIVNIQINFENDPEAALITFASPNEAYAAYKSTEAVLNNRFIRVFWQNKEKENEGMVEMSTVSVKDRLGTIETVGESGDGDNERIVASGINITKTFYNPNHQKKEISQEKVQAVEAIKKSQEQLAAQEQIKRAKEEKNREALKFIHDLQKKKQAMLKEQIEQQKILIRKLETNKSLKPEEKTDLMGIIKTLQGSIENIKKGMEVPPPLPQQQQTPLQPHKSQPKHAASQLVPASPAKAEAARDILDAELDIYNTESEGGDTEALKQRIAALKSQVRSGPYPRRGGRGGYRGRGGRYVLRGGGGANIFSNKVDRRPTTMIVTDFPKEILPELMAHYAQYGKISHHKPDYDVPSLTMTYENRQCAENAFTLGCVYKKIKLSVRWLLEEELESWMEDVKKGNLINNNGVTQVYSQSDDAEIDIEEEAEVEEEAEGDPLEDS